eukprot:4113867-Amphidinium_carterae.1
MPALLDCCGSWFKPFSRFRIRDLLEQGNSKTERYDPEACCFIGSLREEISDLATPAQIAQ